MSQLLINEYLRELAEIRKVSGSKNESAVSEAFKDLLKRWGGQHKLRFLAQDQGFEQWLCTANSRQVIPRGLQRIDETLGMRARARVPVRWAC